MRRAFTLTEMMISILIVGLITATAVISVVQVRIKNRDTQKLTDVKTIQSALEAYYRDENQYPATLTSGQPITGSTTSNTYLAAVPNPPSTLDGNCTSSDYVYSTTNDNHSYTLQFCIAKDINDAAAGNNCATPSGMAACSGGGGQPAQCSGNYSFSNFTGCGDTGIYCGESYPTVQIGTQCWFAKNLNVGTRVDSAGSAPCVDVYPNNGWWSCQIDDSQTEKYCYDNDDSNCTTDGGLYEWAEALQLPYDCNYANSTDNGDGTYTVLCSSGNQTISVQHQGICPTGWHIPSLQELNILAQNADPGCDLISGNCSTAGGKLKATGSHSPISWDGTDDYNFSALPSGNRIVNGSFLSRGDLAYLWSSMPRSGYPNLAWYGYLPSGGTTFYGSYARRAYGFSVRCAQD